GDRRADEGGAGPLGATGRREGCGGGSVGGVREGARARGVVPLPRALRSSTARRARDRRPCPVKSRSPHLVAPRCQRLAEAFAEREGFEPSVPLPVHMISNHAPSTTRSSLRPPPTARPLRGAACGGS